MYIGYGILRKQSVDLGKLAIAEEANLRIIEEGELGMLCATTDENSALTAESMRRYTEILSHVTLQDTIIPLRFGTTFANQEEIRIVLMRQAKEYLKLLAKFYGKIEVELRVWWAKEAFAQMILKNKKIARWKKALENGTRQGYDVVEFGQAVQELVDQERNKLEKVFLAELRSIAVEWVTKEPINEYQAFNGVFMVDRCNEEKFDQAVGVLYDRYAPNLVFKYTGPWAPHHFVSSE